MSDSNATPSPPSFWIVFSGLAAAVVLGAFYGYYAEIGLVWQSFVFAGLTGLAVCGALRIYERNYVIEKMQSSQGSLQHFGCIASLFGSFVVAAASGVVAYYTLWLFVPPH